MLKIIRLNVIQNGFMLKISLEILYKQYGIVRSFGVLEGVGKNKTILFYR